MSTPATDFNHVVDVVTRAIEMIVFTGLATYGVAAAIRRRTSTNAWFAEIFVILTLVTVAAPIAQHYLGELVWIRVTSIALLALVPFGLYRFTRGFGDGRRRFDQLSAAATLAIIAGAVLIDSPAEGEGWSAAFMVYAVAFLAHWTVLSVLSALQFYWESRVTVGIARRRMRLFAAATLVFTATLLLAGARGSDDSISWVASLVQLTGAGAAVLFWFALVPPRALRLMWRASESEAFNASLRELLAGERIEDVRRRLLACVVGMTGARGVVLLDQDGHPLEQVGLSQHEAEVLAQDAASGRNEGHALAAGRLVAAVGPATPFFGQDERRLLDTLGAFGQLAEERAAVVERERTANEQLRRADEIKTEFVAMVAHDLRSPMSVISGFADTIHDRWDVLDDDTKLEYLGLISRNTRSLADLVEDVLQVARIESGNFEYRLHPFAPRTVIDRIVREFQLATEELELVVDAPPDLPPVLGDEERNWQILTNLLSNAIKFTRERPRVRLELRLAEDDSSVSIAVHDNGVGISAEDQERLFQRFSRVGQRRETKGTGLGLYIVKSMVEAQGGRIWVDSTPGSGSTFTYTLPVAPPDQGAVATDTEVGAT